MPRKPPPTAWRPFPHCNRRCPGAADRAVTSRLAQHRSPICYLPRSGQDCLNKSSATDAAPPRTGRSEGAERVRAAAQVGRMVLHSYLFAVRPSPLRRKWVPSDLPSGGAVPSLRSPHRPPTHYICACDRSVALSARPFFAAGAAHRQKRRRDRPEHAGPGGRDRRRAMHSPHLFLTPRQDSVSERNEPNRRLHPRTWSFSSQISLVLGPTWHAAASSPHSGHCREQPTWGVHRRSRERKRGQRRWDREAS